MTRRQFLYSTAAAAQAAQKAAEPGNVLLLITDQQSVYALGANGNRDLATPAMDSLAAEGVSFLESYAAYPVCSPARSAIFTSRMPHEAGVMQNGRPVAAGMPTMGEHFRARGFATVYSGKWHLPQSFGQPPGFTQLYGGAALGANMDEPAASACLKWLSSKPQEPFLMVCSLMNPHDICGWIRAHKGSRPLPDPERYPHARRNLAVDPEEPEYVQNHRRAGYDLMSQAVGIASEWRVDDFRYYLYNYYRLVEQVDRQIARILSMLRLTGLQRNTTVVLTSDHGEGMGSHRWVQKAAFWEETAKVPLIVAGPGVASHGTRNESALVSGIDILPTLCDYAGIPAPPQIRGSSLRSAIEGGRWERPFVVSELGVYGAPEREGRMLRTRRYKYSVFNGGARPEQLFDLELDPGEVYNLAAKPAAGATLEQHRSLLRKWLAETNDSFRIPV
jgi:arylsulfatase A-like enzyme